MYNGKTICIGLGAYSKSGLTVEEEIKAIKKAGFDGIFSGWRNIDHLKKIKALADENGMIYQSVHAPFTMIHFMWDDCPEASDALGELIQCVDDCAEVGVGILVCHVWIGFGDQNPNDNGIANFKKLLDHAEEKGVKIAFENTEGEKYLEYLWENLGDHPAVGFCIDTGHELCYNRGKDMITPYGKDGKLIATHINDNLGVTGEDIFWHDDYHLLPFDGIGDWQGVADRLKAVGYNGILTTELTTGDKPGRTENARYRSFSPAEYYEEAYKRLTKIVELMA